MSETTSEQGLYVYAVVADPGDAVPEVAGLFDRPVRAVQAEGLAALVSEVPKETRIRPERSQLAAHQRVLRTTLETTTPLPIAFGTVVPGEAEVRELLEERREALEEALEHVGGRVEMGLTVSWNVPNIFEYFVNTSAELRDTRDRLLHVRAEPSHADKIEVGRLFDRLLNETRERHTSAVVEVLAPLCADIRRNNPRNEREVLRLACLIDRAAMEAFEKGVFEAAKRFDNSYAFDFNGPWAPHNFVVMEKIR